LPKVAIKFTTCTFTRGVSSEKLWRSTFQPDVSSCPIKYALVFSIASVPGGRGPKSTMVWTCASALSPEKSSQIFF